jgi:hypothetical protein
MDVASLADLLRETAEHHDAYEKAAPPDESSVAAGRYMADVKQVVVSPA